MGIDPIARVACRLAVALEPCDVFIKALRDGVWAAPVVAAVVARKIGKPRTCRLLRLSERKHVLAIGFGHVIGRADRLKRRPCSAL